MTSVAVSNFDFGRRYVCQ